MKITILVDDVWKFNKYIAEYLIRENHEVTFIDSSIIQFKYKNKFQKITNFINKTLFGKNIKKDFTNRTIITKIQNLQQQDFILIINPDVYRVDIINLLKTKAKKYIAHNYDSLERHPLPQNYKFLFDKIFTFDIQDAKKNKELHLLNNFIYTDKEVNLKPKNKFFMILSKSFEREILLSKIAEILDKKQNFNYEFMVVYPDYQNHHPKIHLLNKPISLKKMEEKVKNAEILIDLVRPNQTGLSFRFFEAMAFEKKIITNNKYVKGFDFYNPSNILILDDNFDDIDSEFLNTPYIPVPEEIYNKYTLENWVNTVFHLKNN